MSIDIVTDHHDDPDSDRDRRCDPDVVGDRDPDHHDDSGFDRYRG